VTAGDGIEDLTEPLQRAAASASMPPGAMRRLHDLKKDLRPAPG
jgi:hypothetical protein